LKPCILNATSSVLSPSKCTKIVGGWGFAPYPCTGGAYNAPPDPLAGLRGPLLREGKRRGGEKEGKEEGGSGRRNFRPSQCWKQIDATGLTYCIQKQAYKC